MSFHPNSLAALDPAQANRLEGKILGLMADGKARTDRQIQADLGHPEPIRPRVTNLVQSGYLHEVGAVRCEVTNKRVRLTKRFI